MRVGVIGGGAWGTALAQVAAQGGETLLWSREPEVAANIATAHENTLFLPGVPLSKAIRPTTELADLSRCDVWLVVTPAQHMRQVLEAAPGCPGALLLCSKGIEEASGQLLHQVAREACPGASVMVLSGPSFAHEVAAGLPTALTLAAEVEAEAEVCARASLAPPSASTSATMSQGRRSAGRSRTCWRSPAAWSRAAALARMHARR
jgi:glycerol-3-phosphate dehydrogenase (NAD(P)+)